MEVLKLLVNAGPDVITEVDGPKKSTSLAIALSQHYGMEVIDMFLSASPHCASFPDRRGNYPIHIACCMGASMDVIRRLLRACPEELHKVNIQGKSPLDIAQERTVCWEEVVDFLEKVTIHKLEQDHLLTADFSIQISMEWGNEFI